MVWRSTLFNATPTTFAPTLRMPDSVCLYLFAGYRCVPHHQQAADFLLEVHVAIRITHDRQVTMDAFDPTVTT